MGTRVAPDRRLTAMRARPRAIGATFAGAWLLASVACGGPPTADPDTGEDDPRSDAGDADDAPPGADASRGGPQKIIFATSSKQNGDLGGLAGADAVCGQRAENAGLTGEFKAWVSSPAQSAAERLAHADLPYVLPDGTQVADDWNDLVDGDLDAPIDRDEDGSQVTGDVWTGTRANGNTGAATCGGFADIGELGICGSSSAKSADWSDFIQPFCTSALRLYCVQQ